jgi:hypothetical protein
MSEVKKFVRFEFVSTDSNINFEIDPDTGDAIFTNKRAIAPGTVIKYFVRARFSDGSAEPRPERVVVVTHP